MNRRPNLDWHDLDDDGESMSTLAGAAAAVVLALVLIVAVVVDGREAAARCRAGVDVAASCHGVVR